MKAVVLAAHTDDAEYGVGGTLVNLCSNEHQVVILNMTGASAFCEQGTQTASIVGDGTRVEWMPFEPNCMEDKLASYEAVREFLDQEVPDLIFAHWPIDEHPDHRVTGSFAVRYVNERHQQCIDSEGRFHADKPCPQLLFFEALIGKQTKCFTPNRYVGLTRATFEAKREMMKLYLGTPPTTYMEAALRHHVLMLEFRGREAGVCRQARIDQGLWAEAFVSYPNIQETQIIRLPGEYC